MPYYTHHLGQDTDVSLPPVSALDPAAWTRRNARSTVLPGHCPSLTCTRLCEPNQSSYTILKTWPPERPGELGLTAPGFHEVESQAKKHFCGLFVAAAEAQSYFEDTATKGYRQPTSTLQIGVIARTAKHVLSRLAISSTGRLDCPDSSWYYLAMRRRANQARQGRK